MELITASAMSPFTKYHCMCFLYLSLLGVFIYFVTKIYTDHPTYGITFIYTSDINITLSLRNITQTIINNEIVDIDNNCVLSNDYNINIHQVNIDNNRVQTILYATIFVCEETAETQLLEYDFIGEITEHLVVITDINIDVDIINNGEGIIDKTIVIHNANSDQFHNNSDKTDLILTVLAVVIIILIVIALLLWIYVQRVKHRNGLILDAKTRHLDQCVFRKECYQTHVLMTLYKH